MKLKHDVKYLIAAITLSLAASTTLSASAITKSDEAFSATALIETLQPINVIESSDKVEIPVLAEPKIIIEINDKNNNEENEIEQFPEAESTIPSVPSVPMPIAKNKTNLYIPLLDSAIVFANFDDALPAVANYYTQASEQEIIAFYQLNFGDAISQERKHDRLTLRYQADDLAKRVVISKQNNKRQVDVIIEQATK